MKIGRVKLIILILISKLTKSNMKNLWTGIKSIINTKSKNSLQSISQLTANGEIIQDPQKMANVSVSSQVCSEIPRTKKAPLDYLKNRNLNSFFISPVTYSEIEDIIISLKNEKSTGPFSIPVKLLKLVKSDISRPLACIFNESITLGIFLINSNVQKLSPFIRKELTTIHQIIDQSPYFLFLANLLKN